VLQPLYSFLLNNVGTFPLPAVCFCLCFAVNFGVLARCGFWLRFLGVPLRDDKFFQQIRDYWDLLSALTVVWPTDDKLLRIFPCCSMLFMSSMKSEVNLFETASSSSSSRIFWLFIWSSRSYSCFAAAPPPSVLTVGSILTIAGPWILSGHTCIHLGRCIVVPLLPELYFLKESHVMLPFFRWNLIVITIASNYGCYSVRVFANASKHFDFHQHTGPMQLTAWQNRVQFVPYREHPVWIWPIRVCTCKFSMDSPCLSVGKYVCGFQSQLGSVVTFFVAFRCRLSSAKSCMSVTDFWTSSSSSSMIVSATNMLILYTSASWNVSRSVRLFEKVGLRPLLFRWAWILWASDQNLDRILQRRQWNLLISFWTQKVN